VIRHPYRLRSYDRLFCLYWLLLIRPDDSNLLWLDGTGQRDSARRPHQSCGMDNRGVQWPRMVYANCGLIRSRRRSDESATKYGLTGSVDVHLEFVLCYNATE